MKVSEISSAQINNVQNTVRMARGGVQTAQLQVGTVAQAYTPQNFDLEATPAITPTEKDFFAELYPQAANEIRAYSLYHKSGVVQTPILGTLFDRRG
jgi:hypothetical protein